MPIRITPLIDVVFILLVFFMLTTRLLPVGYLELSNDTDARGAASGEPLPELEVNPDGTVRWNNQDYELPQLLAALRGQGTGKANLATAPATQLTHFTRVLSALDNAGITAHWQRNPTPEL
ncbi:ExbD/TolR family protein [Marinobacter sp. VGCF2001]|uniref:ExbD/TolR family protein n=1 Tax=Marinobacter sp. VGCF2001 TaxID=3417189 RepID=UPI003CF5538D